MDTTEIAALLRPFIQLGEKQLEQTSIYVDVLLQWNARVNLTSVRRAEDIVTRHFGESFFAADQLLQAGPVKSAIDLGSGAGFPGVPFAMLAPQTHVTLIESHGKKAVFLNEVVRKLVLSNVNIFSQRAENYPGMAELVTMRAVENFSRAAVLALKLVEPGGRLALMIGDAQRGEAVYVGKNISWQEPIALPGGHSRILLIGTRPVKVE
jgi:16S rRNA (guanine527-N7)-methyltransferase